MFDSLPELHPEYVSGCARAVHGHPPALPVRARHEPQERQPGPAGHLVPGGGLRLRPPHGPTQTNSRLQVSA